MSDLQKSLVAAYEAEDWAIVAHLLHEIQMAEIEETETKVR